MASLRRLPNSPYWIACFTLPDGTRTQRSTRVPVAGIRDGDFRSLSSLLEEITKGTVTIQEPRKGGMELNARDAKRLAQRIASQFEESSREARARRFTETAARRVISDIYANSNRGELPSSAIDSYFQSWLKRKKLEAGDKTYQRYESVVTQLSEYLGGKASMDITHLDSKLIAGFRDALAKRVTPGTVNVSLKIVRAALAQAKRDGLVDVNEGKRVTLLKRTRVFERRPFTLPELARILEVASSEWRGMIAFGLYTGQRLGDIADLCWNNIDLQRYEIRLLTEKTTRRQIIPMAKPLVRYLESLPVADDPTAPLFPNAYATRQRNQHSGTLSNQFYQILVAAGFAKKKEHRSTGKGRSAKREQNELSFHSLRHTATSLLKNAGVSDAVAQEFIGHDSAAVSRQYTHIETASLRKAADVMPDIFGL